MQLGAAVIQRTQHQPARRDDRFPPRRPSLLSARTPVIIRGTLKEPAPRPEVTKLAAKGAASVALGALLTPVAAILPWVELGLTQDSPCRALLDAATKKEELRKPRAK